MVDGKIKPGWPGLAVRFPFEVSLPSMVDTNSLSCVSIPKEYALFGLTFGQRHRFASLSDLEQRQRVIWDGGLKKPGDAQDPTRRRYFRKIVGECLVQHSVLIHILEIDLDINHVNPLSGLLLRQ